MFTLVHLYLPLFTHVYLCLLVFTYLYYRSLVFTYVYHCLFVHVYLCLPLFTRVYLPAILSLFFFVWYNIIIFWNKKENGMGWFEVLPWCDWGFYAYSIKPIYNLWLLQSILLDNLSFWTDSQWICIMEAVTKNTLMMQGWHHYFVTAINQWRTYHQLEMPSYNIANEL